MQRHTLAGAGLLDLPRQAGLEMARTIALSHHERWDGAGYPHGLKGNEIPIEARIVGAAQVYVALTSNRPYRPAMSQEDALAEIGRLGGFALDPHIAKALERCAPAWSAPAGAQSTS
jgi:putative two-component system response regulator